MVSFNLVNCVGGDFHTRRKKEGKEEFLKGNKSKKITNYRQTWMKMFGEKKRNRINMKNQENKYDKLRWHCALLHSHCNNNNNNENNPKQKKK